MAQKLTTLTVTLSPKCDRDQLSHLVYALMNRATVIGVRINTASPLPVLPAKPARRYNRPQSAILGDAALNSILSKLGVQS